MVFFDSSTLPDISTVGPYDSPYREYYRHNKYRMVFEENPLKRISNDGIPEIAVEGKESLIKDLILESNSHLQMSLVIMISYHVSTALWIKCWKRESIPSTRSIISIQDCKGGSHKGDNACSIWR